MFRNLLIRWRALRRRPALSLVMDVVLILMVMWSVHAWQTRGLPGDEPAPPLLLKTLSGSGPYDAIEAGNTGVVYFFAPWCAYCRSSIGNLDELVENGDIAWASVIALDYADMHEVSEFIRETDVSLPVFLGRGNTAHDWGVRAFPTYFVINGQGKIAGRSVGYSTRLGLQLRAAMAR